MRRIKMSLSTAGVDLVTSVQLDICNLANFCTVFLFSLSELATLLIAGDHYLAIIFPLRYNHIMTRTRYNVFMVSPKKMDLCSLLF